MENGSASALDHKLPPRPRPPLPPLRSLSRPHSIASNPNSRSNSPIPSSFSSTSLARNPSYSTSTTTSDGYLQPSPSISSSTSRVRPTSLYSTPSFTSTRSDGTRLQAKSALTERTTREDLKSLKDMFDMGPEDFDPSPSPLPTSSNQSSSYTLPISYPQISNSHFSPTSSPSSELGGIIRPKTESRTEQVRREEDKRESVRKRRPEAMEWSQTCWVWSTSGKEGNHNVKEGKDGSSVPSSLKKKIGSKRESTQFLGNNTSISSIPTVDLTSMGEGKSPFEIGPDSSTKEGYWRLATGVLKDDGYLRIFSDEKNSKVVLQSIHLPSTPRTDISRVDYSLFSRPHCIVLHRHSSSPLHNNNNNGSTKNSTNSTQSSPRNSSSSQNPFNSNRSNEEPVYLCLPSNVSMQTWLVMMLCFAKPEFLDSAAGGGEGVLDIRSSPSGRALEYPDSDISDDDEDDKSVEGVGEGKCRIYRSITIVLNEGRGIGELGTEIVADSPGKAHSITGSSNPIPNSRVQPKGALVGSSLRDNHGHSNHENGSSSSTTGIDTFCEVIVEGEVVARTSIKRGTTSPYWNETFILGDLPPFLKPLTITISEVSKNSKPTILGSAIVRVPDLPRCELIQDWWCIKPILNDVKVKPSDTLGEISLSIRIDEDVVLPKKEYGAILDLLSEDTEAELAVDISSEFPQQLEEVTKLLLRIYQAQNVLVPRILRLATLEIEGDSKSSATLFRGNSILTKSIELYLRLVGREYMEASIGGVIRKVCEGKIKIEIDPAKMVGMKEKDLAGNVKELKELCGSAWKDIYAAREKCPHEIREIFSHIQSVVTEKYGSENPNMVTISISAFIFLRFFVPAILNPQLFNLVSITVSPSSQRTLTLIAKTLQGLANFSSFGVKEVWMGSMNDCLKENEVSYVDFIKYISTPLLTAPDEWTSNLSTIYLASSRVRNGLSTSAKEGIPLLPHLIDLPRDLASLSSILAKSYPETLPSTPHSIGNDFNSPSTNSLSSQQQINSRTFNRSARYYEFTETCLEVYEEARKRGGGSMGNVPLNQIVQGSNSFKSKGRLPVVRSMFSSPDSSSNQPPLTPEKDRLVNGLRNESPPSSVNSRRSNRSFKVGRDLFPEFDAARGSLEEER